MARLIGLLVASLAFAAVRAAENQEPQELGELAAGAVPGIVDGVMGNFFGSSQLGSWPKYGQSQQYQQPPAFIPQMSNAESIMQQQPQIGGAQLGIGQIGQMGQIGQIPFLSGFSSFMNSFGTPFVGATLDAAAEEESEAETDAAQAGSPWDNLFPTSNQQAVPAPNFDGFGIPSSKCYMASGLQKNNVNLPCNTDEETRYEYDMLKQACEATSFCPQYGASGDKGFKTIEECMDTCTSAAQSSSSLISMPSGFDNVQVPAAFIALPEANADPATDVVGQ